MAEQTVKSKSYGSRPKLTIPKIPRWMKLFSPFNFLWIIGFVGVVLLIETQGTPHLLVTYTYRATPDHKSTCNYYGLTQRTEPAHNGACPFITFLR